MVVVDASIIFKWFDKTEIYSSEARELLESHLSGDEEICIPSLIYYEMANAWSTKTSLPKSKLLRNLRKLEMYSLAVIFPEFDQLKLICNFLRKYDVTAYDATYAVLAMEKKC